MHAVAQCCSADCTLVTMFTLTHKLSITFRCLHYCYSYKGSLTTPPCSEIVNWVVMEEPVQVSQGQLDEFRKGLADIKGSLASSSGDDNR
jgi:Eukaryotic-type carbonic anhydrase